MYYILYFTIKYASRKNFIKKIIRENTLTVLYVFIENSLHIIANPCYSRANCTLVSAESLKNPSATPINLGRFDLVAESLTPTSQREQLKLQK